MRKGIIVFTSLIIILILVVGAIPLIDGYLFKSTFLNQLNALAQESANDSVRFNVEQYDLGWLKSRLKLHLLSTDTNVNKQFPNGITVEYNIHHGPFVHDPVSNQYVFAYAILTSDIYLPSEIEMMIGKQNHKPILKMQTIVSFNDTWMQHIAIETLSIPNAGVIQFADTTGVTNFTLINNVLQSMSLSGTIGAITVTADKNNTLIPDVLIQPVSISQKLDRQEIGLWNSDSHIKFPSVSIKWKDGNGLNIEKLELSSMHGIDANNAYNGSFNLSTGKLDIQYNDKNIPSITDTSINMAVNNLDPNGINDYLKYIMSLNKKTAMTSQDEQNKIQQKFLNIITLKSNASMNIAINTSFGALSVKSKIVLPAETPVPMTLDGLEKNAISETNARIAGSLLLYVEAESLKSDIARQQSTLQVALQPGLATSAQKIEETGVMQKAVVGLTPDQIPQAAQKKINDLVAQGILIKDNNDYVINLIYQNNVYKVNGKEMPASVFMQLNP